jgi:hypothetical protein
MDQMDVLRRALKDDRLVSTGEWPAYAMLKAIMSEESTPEKKLYQELVTEYDAPYVDGSLCELEIIQRKFKWKDNVNVFAINASWRRANMEVALNAVVADKMKDYIQTLEDRWFHIEDWECGSLRPRIETKSVDRGLKRWIKYQFLIMRGCWKPWVQSKVGLPGWSSHEFIRRYFFEGMEWHSVEMNKQGAQKTGKLVEKSYFNLESKCVFLQFVPPPAG